MIRKSDIVDFRIDYKKNDWIRAIMDVKNAHTIIVHWDYVTSDASGMPEQSPRIEESWTHTAGGEYNRSERETIIAVIKATDEYKKLVQDWPLAAEIISWKLKHPETENAALPPSDQYFGVY